MGRRTPDSSSGIALRSLGHRREANPCQELHWKVRLLPTSSPTNWGCTDVNSGALEVSPPWERVCETGPFFFLSREGFLVLLLFSLLFLTALAHAQFVQQNLYLCFFSPKSVLISLSKVENQVG